MWEYFNDRRYRQHRILMAIMVPTVLLALAGVGGLVYLQEKHQRLAAEESPPVPAPRKEAARPVAPPKAAPTATPKAAPSATPEATPGAAPAAPDKRIENAVLAFRTGDRDGARKLMAGVDLDKAGMAPGWELAGLLAERDGNKKAAADFYSRGIAAVPSVGLYYRRAALHRANGEFDPSLDDFNRAIALDPSDIVLSNSLLLLLIQMGNKKQATEEMKALNDLGTDGGGRLFALCGVLLEGGEFTQAASVLEAGKKVVPREIFEQMLNDPVLSRHQGRPQIMPFYIINLKNLPANKPAK